MEGMENEGDWGDEGVVPRGSKGKGDGVDGADGEKEEGEGGGGRSREGRWESGVGRCAVTGRRVLGGTDGLRRVMA